MKTTILWLLSLLASLTLADDILPWPSHQVTWSYEPFPSYQKIPSNITKYDLYAKIRNNTLDNHIKIRPFQERYRGSEWILYYDGELSPEESFLVSNYLLRSSESRNHDLGLLEKYSSIGSLYHLDSLVLIDITLKATSRIDPSLNKLTEMITSCSWINSFRPWIGIIIDLSQSKVDANWHRAELLRNFMRDYSSWYDFILIKKEKDQYIYYPEAYIIEKGTDWEIEVYNSTLSLKINYPELAYQKNYSSSYLWSIIYDWVILPNWKDQYHLVDL